MDSEELGDWTSYGGGGYVINHADGQKDYPFGGWLLQKDFGEKWTLGGEVFARGKDTVDGQATTIVNFGGLTNSRPISIYSSPPAVTWAVSVTPSPTLASGGPLGAMKKASRKRERATLLLTGPWRRDRKIPAPEMQRIEGPLPSMKEL